MDTAEPISRALRRVTSTELTRALDALASLEATEGIHAARKAVKRTRAMLRLVRDQVGRDAFRSENRSLRDTGRRLSEARSAFVVARTAEELVATIPPILPPAAGKELVARLDARHRMVEDRVLAEAESGTSVREEITESRARIGLWGVDDPDRGYFSGPAFVIPDDFTSIARGIRRVYRRGLRAMAHAYDEPSTESFHAWRKRVRYLRYQMEALHLMWPTVLGEFAEELASLAEVLGEEHDLAELIELVEREPGLLPTPEHRAMLADGVERRRAALRERAKSLGARVYAEKPDDFVARLGSYWGAWRADAAT